ncbi:hypothetical protein, conserved [Plasmodium gonderi]|uniref:Eukaryotic translation initiation factor 2A n=1 Tax=Plasmodium gonderi TaxID=77519 RepID=A0A1Y1JK07_PLAGO|nr:hypothetical protein, conserved [Plasmodium gonderi]GAW82856.1 hypothetical protein, conserved [Plasmodium gonderi]
MSAVDENKSNNLYFLTFSKNKVTIYEYDVSLSSCIIEDIENEIKKSEQNVVNDTENGKHASVYKHVNNENNKRECTSEKDVNRNIIEPNAQVKKSGNKFNNDFLLNRGIRIYKEFEDVELITCTNDYKKIIIVRKENLNVAQVIDIKNKQKRNDIYIRTKTPIKGITTSPKDTHIVLYCQYKPEISAHNLFVYRLSNKGVKKKEKKSDSVSVSASARSRGKRSAPHAADRNENIVIEKQNSDTDTDAASSASVDGDTRADMRRSCETNHIDEPVRVDTLKTYSSNTWPFYKWSASESICAIRINNKICIYKENDFSSYVQQLRLENLEFFDISPEQSKKKGVLIATYERGGKGKPSVFKIFNLSNLEKYIYSKTFFNSDEMKIKWNKNASALLLNVHTQVDKEKQYYYGLSNLFFIDTEKLNEVNIMTDRGQIYDSIWSYNQNKFYVCKGDIPAEIVVYDKHANVTHSFGRHKFNTLKLNCSEKLLLTAGFGNLSGDISIWNTTTKKEITKTKSSCAVICEFFNDGKHFITATTHPRLRVDNNLKIFTYDGFIVSRINFEELYKVIILPINKIKYQESDASLGVHMENSNKQFYIHKQLGIDSKKIGIYRAPGTSGALSITLNGFMNSKKPAQKSSKPPGSNFVQDQKKKTSQKKKKKKKNIKNEEEEEVADGHDVEEDT